MYVYSYTSEKLKMFTAIDKEKYISQNQLIHKKQKA